MKKAIKQERGGDLFITPPSRGPIAAQQQNTHGSTATQEFRSHAPNCRRTHQVGISEYDLVRMRRLTTDELLHQARPPPPTLLIGHDHGQRHRLEHRTTRLPKAVKDISSLQSLPQSVRYSTRGGWGQAGLYAAALHVRSGSPPPDPSGDLSMHPPVRSAVGNIVPQGSQDA